MTETVEEELRRLRAEFMDSVTRGISSLTKDIGEVKLANTRIEVRLESLVEHGSKKSISVGEEVNVINATLDRWRGALYIMGGALAALWGLFLIYVSHKW